MLGSSITEEKILSFFAFKARIYWKRDFTEENSIVWHNRFYFSLEECTYMLCTAISVIQNQQYTNLLIRK